MHRRARPRRGHIPYWLLAASIAAAVAAVLPIAFAVIGGVGGKGVPSRAFASAPPGLVVVGVRSTATEDVIVTAPVNDMSSIREVARVPHLPGYISSGAISPDGSMAAVISADGGTPAAPTASLFVVTIASGELRRVVTGIDQLQTATWSRDGAALFLTRSSASGPLVDVEVLRAAANGSDVTTVATFGRVLGAYPLGETPSGALLVVLIDGRGSTVVRSDGSTIATLGDGITRDWKLSPDGTQVAFIETALSGGVQYHQRVTRLDGAASPGAAAAQSAVRGEQLGVAWAPKGSAPTFGQEPGSSSAGVAAQSNARGFDVPLAYSPEGTFLAVQAWSGSSFQAPGEMRYEAVAADGGREEIPFTRFFGWASR